MGLVNRPLVHYVPANSAGITFARAFIEVVCRGASFGARLPHTVVRAQGPRGAVRGEWVGAQPRPGEPLLYYVHGSGYVVCSPGSHRGLVSELSRRLGRSTFSLDYRLAPKYTFPAAHDDTLNGYLWLLEQGYAASDIIVAGDSAGGHLALALCGQLRELGVAQPRAVLALSPMTDVTWQRGIERDRVVRDPFMTGPGALRFTGRYTAGADLSDGRLDVAATVGPDQPPTLLQVGSREMLSADAEHYALAARAVGAPCELQVWDGMFHVFQMAYRVLPEAGAALEQIEQFVAKVDAAVAATPRAAAG